MSQTQASSITVLLPAREGGQGPLNTIVPFTVFQEGDNYKAVPMIKPEERMLAALPSEINFSFRNNTIYYENSGDKQSMELVKNILRELVFKEQQYR